LDVQPETAGARPLRISAQEGAEEAADKKETSLKLLSRLAQALGLGMIVAAAGVCRCPGQRPSKPIKIVGPFAAGGTSDILARTLGERLQVALKQTVIVDNKAGAGGVIGADSVAKAPADGYTLLLGTIATHAINPALLPKMPYDALKDFTPCS
jgi:tripartite-type tricarboxylate transporter receptor subunit TctC